MPAKRKAAAKAEKPASPKKAKEEESKEETKGLKLMYWGGRGLMEIPRTMLSTKGKVAGKDFEDFRAGGDNTPTAEELGSWNCGRMPMVHDNGVEIGQSGAICRYIARSIGMMGANEAEAGQIDSIFETVKELMDAFYKVIPYDTSKMSESDLKVAYDKWLDSPAPKNTEPRDTRHLHWFLTHLENVVGSNGFAVGKQASLADAALYNTLYENCEDLGDKGSAFKAGKERVDKIVKGYPKLEKICKKYGSSAGMKKWLSSRGKQNF